MDPLSTLRPEKSVDDVGGFFNEGRSVARPDAERRIAGAVGRADHRFAARGEDDPDAAVLHESRGPLDCGD